MPNRLKDATSPYLRQHADNPVEWYPWGPEAFAAAREGDRPILLSIGYSACHWCHVMAHESFEDAETAALMNRLYVNIKVDREEHPDVDQIYQHALQLFSEGGGWPLTMFLLPSGEPFFGGTYFPPEDRYGRPSFRRVLQALAQAYRDQAADVREQAGRIVAALGQIEGRGAGAGDEGGEGGRLPPRIAERGAAKLLPLMDPQQGGFQGAPKFPNASSLELQLRGAHRSGDPEEARLALLTLSRMAEGGIYDQLGGGFSRYSTDERWLVPHFEKMLYDNGQLLRLYAAGVQLRRGDDDEALYARVLRETLGWLEREMRDASGGLYAAQDADSEGVEGKYFVFTPEEVAAICGAEAGAVLCRCYDVKPGGNWNDPHGHGPRGASILHVVDRPRDEREAALLAEAKAKLLGARLRRVPPGTDDKILTGWNGLALSGLCGAGRALGDEAFLRAARRTADFLLERLRGPDGALLRVFAGGKQGQATLPATLDDHAFLAEGLYCLAEASGELRYLAEARALTDAALLRFYDEASGAFYLAEEEPCGVRLPVRPTSLHDSAIPSGLSVACKNLLRLGELLGDEGKDPGGRRYHDIAARALARHADAALRNPFGLSSLLCAADLLQSGLTLIVIAYPAERRAEAEALRAAAAAVYVPDPFTLLAPAGGEADVPPALRALRALAEGKAPRGGLPTAYVCRGQTCSAPVTDAATLQAALRT